MEDVVQRFEGIRWHDSKLVALCFYRAGSEEQVRISLELLEQGGALRPAEIIFAESAYLETDVYLQAKRVCSDDISSAQCHTSSDWIMALRDRNPHDTFEGYFHFEIYLIPPGGTINILAKEFVLKTHTERQARTAV